MSEKSKPSGGAEAAKGANSLPQPSRSAAPLTSKMQAALERIKLNPGGESVNARTAKALARRGLCEIFDIDDNNRNNLMVAPKEGE